jgi:hypothetical protein
MKEKYSSRPEAYFVFKPQFGNLTSRSIGQPKPALLRSIAPVRYVARFALHSAA